MWVLARLTANGLELFDSAPLTFVAGPTAPGHSTLGADRTRITADGADAVTLTITLRDAHDNPVPGHEVEVTHNGVDVAITPSMGVSDSQGVVVFTASSTEFAGRSFLRA